MIAAISSYLFCTEILFNFLNIQNITLRRERESNRCRKGEKANVLTIALAGRTITHRNFVISIYIIAVQRLQFAGSKSFAFFSFVIT